VSAPRHPAPASSEPSEQHAGLRVLGGSPTPEELAAVVAVLQAAAADAEAHGHARVDETPRSAWDASARGLRTPLVRGAGNWVRSLR
jgi:hypothetical protein